MEKKCPKYELLSVDDIQLDMRNPRIAKWVEMYGNNVPAEQIALALGAGGSQDGEGGPSFSNLKQSIETYGGIIHPIIINRELGGKLVVIEGNTRVQLYKELKDSGREGSWEKIPAMVYDGMSEEEIDAIRLQAHLVGTRQWDPYSKAKYLDYLHNRAHLTFGQIVDFCGGDRREVENYIQAYQDMEKYYRPQLGSDQDFDHTRFSAFVELQSSRITEALLSSKFTKKDFAKWVHERKFSPLNTVRKLPRILENRKSLTVFLSEGAEEAIKILEAPSVSVDLSSASLEQLAREICKRISRIEYSEIQRLRNEPRIEEKEIICDAKDALAELCKDINPNL